VAYLCLVRRKDLTWATMMQTAAFGTSSGCSLWRSRSARFASPCTITSGTTWPWGAGLSPRARGIAAICSPGTVAMASCPFRAHFTLVKAALRDHHQSRMSGLVFLLRLIRFIMSNVSSSHTQTPNQSLEPTALWRCASMPIFISVASTGAQLRFQSGGSAPSR